MGVREFNAWCEVTKDQTRSSTSPESWDGYESDPFWQGAHKRR
jgi:hypothetical protein